jgi:Ca2+/Na+ antiporter
MIGFSFMHLIALLAGIIIILFIRRRYRKIRTTELVIIIVLYAVFVLLFTAPVVNLIKKLLT